MVSTILSNQTRRAERIFAQFGTRHYPKSVIESDSHDAQDRLLHEDTYADLLLITKAGIEDTASLKNFQRRVGRMVTNCNDTELIRATQDFLKFYKSLPTPISDTKNTILLDINDFLLREIIVRYQEGKYRNPIISDGIQSFLQNYWSAFTPDCPGTNLGDHNLSHLIMRAAELADVELLSGLASQIQRDNEVNNMPVEIFSLETTISDALNFIPKDTRDGTEGRLIAALETIAKFAITASEN